MNTASNRQHLLRRFEAFESAVEVQTAPIAVYRIYAISDVHVDADENWSWLEALAAAPDAVYARSALILPGDVCTDLTRLERALRIFCGVFRAVFYCVGNHELWSYGKDAPDSIERLLQILTICRRIGVHTEPAVLDVGEQPGTRVRVVPLHSWHSPAFCPARPPSGYAKDFDAACKWPSCVNTYPSAISDGSAQAAVATTSGGSASAIARARMTRCSTHHLGARHSLAPGIAEFMARLNLRRLGCTPDPHLRRDMAAVGTGVKLETTTDVVGTGHIATASSEENQRMVTISCSHFLPLPELYRGMASLTHVMGSPELMAQVTALAPTVHVFGHSHMDCDEILNGTRYVQHALGMPHDRIFGVVPKLPKCVWPRNGENGPALY